MIQGNSQDKLHKMLSQKSQGKHIISEDKAGLLTWPAASACTFSCCRHTGVSSCTKLPGQDSESLSTGPFTNQGPEGISSLVPWASIHRHVRQMMPIGPIRQLHRCYIWTTDQRPPEVSNSSRVLWDRTKAQQPSQFSAFLLILPRGEGVGSCRLPEKRRDPSTVWRPHPNLSFFFEFTNTPTWSFQLEEKSLPCHPGQYLWPRAA